MTHRTGVLASILTALILGVCGCTVYVTNGPPPEAAPPPPPPVAEAPPAYQPPPDDVLAVYHQDLEPYGQWVNISPYGLCWVPSGRPGDWSPYTYGHWVYCDDNWTWVSDDVEAAWGPVVYHYGAWYYASGIGWAWVPGTTWAPAWVAWREGGGYMCWAPLPPEVVFYGGPVDVVYVNRYVPAERYVVVDERYADQPGIRDRIVRNNVTIVNRTTNITNITIVNGQARNRGVSVDNVERATGRPVEHVTVTRASTPQEARQLAASGRPVIYSPAVIQQAEQKRAAERDAQREKVAAEQQAAEQRKQQDEQEKTQRDQAAAQQRLQEQQQQRDDVAAQKAREDQDRLAQQQTDDAQKVRLDQERAQREQAQAQAKADAQAKQKAKEQQEKDAAKNGKPKPENGNEQQQPPPQ